MQNFYIHGHGVYQPANGFVAVPANFMVSLYTDFAKLLSWSTVRLILQDPASVQPLRTVGEYKMVPNFTYLPLPEDDRARARSEARAGLRLMFLNQQMTLRQMLAGIDGNMGKDVKRANTGSRVHAEIAGTAVPAAEVVNIHWLCCQAVTGLADNGGGGSGFNAADRRHAPVPSYQCTARDPVTRKLEVTNRFLPRGHVG